MMRTSIRCIKASFAKGLVTSGMIVRKERLDSKFKSNLIEVTNNTWWLDSSVTIQVSHIIGIHFDLTHKQN